MSFQINWNAFASQVEFQSHIRELLTKALNKKKPHILEDKIKVLNLDWGTEAPSLELLEVGDLSADRFRGVFNLKYNGGATITVSTKVQANLLNVSSKSSPSSFITPKYVGALTSFPIPLNLTLRNIRLQGTVIVVFNKTRGLTLVFRNDPLRSIEVSSSFDTFPIIASFLQQQIETQIRTLFREELPSVLYQLSLNYLPHINGMHAQIMAKTTRDEHQVKFEDFDSDGSVSLINLLHIEAISNSRRTLSLNTPIIPSAILRSQLKYWILQNLSHVETLSLSSENESVYDKIYEHSKHRAPKSTRNHKRRVVRLRKNDKKTEEQEKVSSNVSLESPNTPEIVPAKTHTILEPTTVSSDQIPVVPIISVYKKNHNGDHDKKSVLLHDSKSEKTLPSKASVKSKASRHVQIESIKTMDLEAIVSDVLLKRLQKRLYNTIPAHLNNHPWYFTQQRMNMGMLDGKNFGSHAPIQIPVTCLETGIPQDYSFPIHDINGPPPAYHD